MPHRCPRAKRHQFPLQHVCPSPATDTLIDSLIIYLVYKMSVNCEKFQGDILKLLFLFRKQSRNDKIYSI